MSESSCDKLKTSTHEKNLLPEQSCTSLYGPEFEAAGGGAEDELKVEVVVLLVAAEPVVGGEDWEEVLEVLEDGPICAQEMY